MGLDFFRLRLGDGPWMVLKLTAAATATGVGLYSLYWHFSRDCSETRPPTPIHMELDYETLRVLVEDEALPAMVVDLDAFDHNVNTAASICRQANKTLRLASKSIRVPTLIQRCLQLHPDVFRGIMCFSVSEALFLAETLPEARDFLVAYPCVQRADIAAARDLQRNYHAKIVLMVDCVEHVRILDRLWHAADPATSLFVCVDFDASYRLFNSVIHIGAHRSPCHTVEDLADVIAAIEASQHLLFGGLMTYEAQIAGVPDHSSSRLLDMVLRFIKILSRRDLAGKRAQIRDFLNSSGGSGRAALQWRRYGQPARGRARCCVDRSDHGLRLPAVLHL